MKHYEQKLFTYLYRYKILGEQVDQLWNGGQVMEWLAFHP